MGLLLENGVPLAVLESGEIRWLGEHPPERMHAIAAALTRKPVSPKLRMYLGISGRKPPTPGQVSEWRRPRSAV